MECTKSNPLECCLFFTANSLARDITRMGEEEFASIGMTPSYAFLMMLAIESPGISQKEISQKMNMAPSTVSRFIDALVKRGILQKEGQGRMTFIHPTDKGLQLQESIKEVWKNLYERYSIILGKENGDELTRLCLEASRKLQQE
ncbi:MarR family winged helix-turn-helix transcriptional regulator [Desulfosediminicola flagellatus]|uniref:MarR family winged helix-turn-helix transcriptional regulator n=1 Tax=Desulfosediminicola flagellatus TaxID=2569541 RepID=UPI0010AB73C3|nr:MarR family transcriptional regulator [Desulfosediminicola flagellatus]